MCLPLLDTVVVSKFEIWKVILRRAPNLRLESYTYH
jgi:hypothetical protein